MTGAALLRIGPWVALVASGLVIWGMWGELGTKQAKLDAANAVIQQREKDAAENAKAVAQLAQKLTDTETKVITVTEKVYAAPVTRECAQSPAMRVANDGVRSILSGGQTGDSAKPPSPLR